MTPDLFWIAGPWPGRLAISTRHEVATGLRTEVSGWRNSGLDTVVSLLEPDEAGQLGLNEERALALSNENARAELGRASVLSASMLPFHIRGSVHTDTTMSSIRLIVINTVTRLSSRTQPALTRWC